MSVERKVEAERLLLERQPWIEVYQESVRLPNGRLVDDFYTIAIPDYVVVAGFDDDGNVLAERPYRHGARAITLALPSGYVDRGEEPVEAARRELYEEIGYEAESWDLLGRFGVDGNRGCGSAHLFVATDLTRVGAPDGLDLATIDVEMIPCDQLLSSLMNGGVIEQASAAALSIAAIRRELPRYGGSRIGLEG